MAFEPQNESVSKETFSEDTARGFTLTTNQVIRDGRLKLKGTATSTPDPDRNWAEATWTQTSQFRPLPDESAPVGVWDYNTTVPANTSDQASGLLPYSPPFLRRTNLVLRPNRRPNTAQIVQSAIRSRRTRVATILDAETNEAPIRRTGLQGRTLLGRRRAQRLGSRTLKLESDSLSEVDYVQQNTSESESFWPDNVDNAAGWTAEFRAMIPEGTSEIIFDDGDVRATLFLNKKGIFLDTSASDFNYVCPIYWHDSFKRVRVAGQGNDIFILTEDGFSYVGTSALSATVSQAKDLKVGFVGDSVGLMYLDYFHQSHGNVYLDRGDDVGYTAVTTEEVGYSPAIHHSQAVIQFVSATVKSIGPYDGGTTKVRAQYQNTSNPGWNDLGAFTTLTEDITDIDLTGITADGDGSDQVRFALSLQASNTSTRPASIDQITVLTDFNLPEFSMNPDHGPLVGGNTVRILAINGATLSASDDVYVAGVQLNTSDITFVDSEELSVTWPAGVTGPASVRVETPTVYFPDRPYRYVDSYNKYIDRAAQLARVCGTRSAFRIKNEVPNGEVNLAYISAPGIEAQSHVGVIDLSYLESGNVVGGSAQADLLDGTTLDVPGSTFTYTSPPNTDEVAIAAGSAGWRELGVPAPLYYYHVIGGGRYYIRKEQASIDLEELRDSITVHYADGSAVLLEDFPWDILLVDKDIHGEDLPANTYFVVLLTNRKYIPGETVFLTTTVADPSNEMRLIQGYTEVVNTAPIYRLDTEGNMTYDVEIAPTTGAFTLNIRAK